MDLISGAGVLNLAGYHDIIADGRAHSRTLPAIADTLCIEHDVLTTEGSLGAYCARNAIPRATPYRPERALTDKQRAIIRAIPEGRMPYGMRKELAARFGVSTVTIWKARAVENKSLNK